MAVDFATNFLLNQGPLSEAEQVLKAFLLRDQLTKFGSAVGQNTGKGADGAASSGAGFTPLGLVRPGDLITADYINTIVSAVNEILTYLRRQQFLAADGKSSAGIIGVAKNAKFAAADAENNVEVSFPAASLQASDLTDILIGNIRIDPATLVKTPTGYSFKVPQSALGDNVVRIVANAGAASRVIDVIG